MLVITTGFLQGFSLLLLQPLLEFTNITTAPASQSHQLMHQFFHAIHYQGSLSEVLIIYVGIITIIATLSFIQSRFNSYLVNAYNFHLHQKLYSTFISSHWLEIATTKRSDLNQLLTREIPAISYGISLLIRLVSTLIIASIYIATACLLSWKLTLVASISGLVLYVLLNFQSRIAKRLGNTRFQCSQKLYSTLNDHFVGAKLAKTYCLEEQFKFHFQKIKQEILKQTIRFVTLQATNQFVYTTGGAIIFSFIFYYSVTQLHIPIVTLFVLLIIFARLIPQLSSFQKQYQTLLNTLPSFEGIQNMLEKFNKTKKTEYIETNEKLLLNQSITFNNISFSYNNLNDRIFSNINLTLPAHQVTAIIGPSGSGKSTFIDILIGLLEPNNGEIRIDNKLLNKENLKAWRNTIAYVPQNDYLLNDTIRKNLTWISHNIDENEITQALKKANIYDFIQQLPCGLDTLVGDDGVCLSGGEKQRIMLARALLRNPSLLILDEATCALDLANENAIFEVIRHLPKNITVLIVSHRISSLHWADEIIEIQKGNIIQSKNIIFPSEIKVCDTHE